MLSNFFHYLFFKRISFAFEKKNWQVIEKLMTSSTICKLDNEKKFSILMNTIQAHSVSWVEKALSLNINLDNKKREEVLLAIIVIENYLIKSPKKTQIFHLVFEKVLKKDFLENKVKYFKPLLTFSVGGNYLLYNLSSTYELFEYAFLSLNVALSVKEKEEILDIVLSLNTPLLLKNILALINFDLATLIKAKNYCINVNNIDNEEAKKIIQNCNIQVFLKFPLDHELKKQMTNLELLDLYIEKLKIENMLSNEVFSKEKIQKI